MFRTWARRLSKATLDNENCIVCLNSEPMAACKRQVKTPVKFFFGFFFQWFYTACGLRLHVLPHSGPVGLEA